MILLGIFVGNLFSQTHSFFIITDELDTIPPQTTSIDSFFLWDPLWKSSNFYYYLGQIGKPYIKFIEGVPSRFIQNDKIFSNYFTSNEYVYMQTPDAYLHSRDFISQVRFDQSSRKTQLLNVLFNSPFKTNRGNLNGFYKRRTSEGAYYNSFTDHYLIGISSLVNLWKDKLHIGLRWNFAQLTDGINGGTFLPTNPTSESHFNKSGTSVLLPTAYRSEKRIAYQPEMLLNLNQGSHWSSFIRTSFLYELFEHTFSAGRERVLYPDSLPFQWVFGAIPDTIPFYEMDYFLKREKVSISFLNRYRFSSTDSSGKVSSIWTIANENRYWRGNQLITSLHDIRYKIQHQLALVYKNWNAFNCINYEKSSLFSRPAFQTETRVALKKIEFQHTFQSNFPPLQDLHLQTPFFTPLGKDTIQNPTVNSFRFLFWWSHTKKPLSSRITFFYNTLKNGIFYDSHAQPLQEKRVAQSSGVLYHLSYQWSFIKTNGWYVFYFQRGYPYFPQHFGSIQIGWLYTFHESENQIYVGIQVSGFSGYEGLFYNPVTEIFFSPTSFSISPYYRIDGFAVLSIQERFKAYLFLYHLNEGFTQPGYFTVPYYPMLERTFSFGIEWILFN